MRKKYEDWQIICTRCHEESAAAWVVPGSTLVEGVLYLLTLPLLCTPGIAFTGVREILSHWACRVCNCREIVPVGSVRGRALLQSRNE